MCGIFGYIGSKECSKILFNGIKRLEYRGYDSVGIATTFQNKIYIKKGKGKIDDVQKRINLLDLPGTIGISHTRWSTHGIPSDLNAHPHEDCKNTIAIVHNGIIENFSSLKEWLIKKGHNFKSETDSEVLAHLIEEFYDGNLKEAVTNTLLKVEGTYGLIVLHKDKKELVGARNGSPLVLGIGKKEFFIASDVAPIVEFTKDVIYLNDKEIVSICDGKYEFTNLQKDILDKKIDKVTWDIKEIEKKGFKHFMLKEIYEQPESLRNSLRGRLKDNDIKITINIDDNFLKNLKRIIITACGTAWHASLIGKYLIEKYCRIHVEVDYASEFRYRDPIIDENDLLIVVSQSGETADTLAALREAKSKKAKTLGIINVVGSTIAREVDGGIYIHAGPEVGVASTKAFTSQITCLFLFTLYLMKLKNIKIDKKLITELKKIPDKVDYILKNNNIKEIAKKYYKKTNFLYLGRGVNFPVALEGALKLKEISYIHAEGYPAAEMKHGPIALIDENMPVVFIANKNGAYNKIISNMEEVRARNGKIIVLATEGDKEIKKKSDHVIYIPKTLDELTPILNTIPLQLLSYYIADLRGCEIDQPRNLAKSVTVE